MLQFSKQKSAEFFWLYYVKYKDTGGWGPHLGVCQVVHTHPPRAAGAGGGRTGMPYLASYTKNSAFLRVSECNSVLVLDQMGSEAHKKRGATMPLSFLRAAHRACRNILWRQGNHIAV